MLKNLKKGSILSETSFYVVKEVKGNAVTVVDDLGNDLQIGGDYVNAVLSPADYFEKEEKKNMTELADLFINSPRVAMTVAFYKKDVAKTKKAYEAEVAHAIATIQNAKISEVEGLLRNLAINPIAKVVPGDLRVMKGRHYGSVDDLGRVHFVDMEQDKGTKADYDARMRQVDPRTIQYIIVNKVKYSLK